jgi:flagellar protein FliS
MMTPTNSLAYRKASLQHASTVGLVIALYDTLHGNLSRAAAAMERNDIQSRCAELVHGFNVLQQLELMVNTENGGQAAANLRRFYTHLRGHMIKAQFTLSPALLREQMKMLITVREAWQQVDARGTHQAEAAHGSNGYGNQSAHLEGQSSSMIHPHGLESERSSSSFSCSV